MGICNIKYAIKIEIFNLMQSTIKVQERAAEISVTKYFHGQKIVFAEVTISNIFTSMFNLSSKQISGKSCRYLINPTFKSAKAEKDHFLKTKVASRTVGGFP